MERLLSHFTSNLNIHYIQNEFHVYQFIYTPLLVILDWCSIQNRWLLELIVTNCRNSNKANDIKWPFTTQSHTVYFCGEIIYF